MEQEDTFTHGGELTLGERDSSDNILTKIKAACSKILYSDFPVERDIISFKILFSELVLVVFGHKEADTKGNLNVNKKPC